MSEKASDSAAPASAILSALEKDLDANECRSVEACLGHVFHSKQRPATVVQSLLVDLNPDAVRAAHGTLLQNYLTENNSTSLVFMKRVAATVWFIQLLLECRSVQDTRESCISDQEANEMALLLLQNLFKTIMEMLQSETMLTANDAENIDVNAFLATTVASFTIGASLKVVSPYVSSLPFLLSPLWKGICDIASCLTTFPGGLAETTLKALLTYLQEGQSHTMSTLEQYIQTRQVSQLQAVQVKLLVFFVARCSVVLRVFVASRRQASDNFECCSTVLTDVATILLQLRGLALATRVHLKHKYTVLTEQDEAFLNAYQQLELKIEQCLVNSWPRLSTSSELAVLERHDLNELLRLQPESTQPNKSLQHELIASSFAVGKALVLQSLLVQTVADFTSLPSTLREAQVQSLLLMCQELLFSTLPHCTDVNDSSTLFAKCLDAMASATVLCHAKGAVEERSHLDRLLIRWLSPATDSQLHPLTRELLLSLIQLHTLQLCQAHSVTTRSDSPQSVDLSTALGDAGQKCLSVKPLISLLVKLLFDPRTQTGLRRNVASATIRLVGASRGAADSLPSVIVQHLIAIELQQCIKQDVKVERRKRKKGKSDYHSQVRALGSFDVDSVRCLVEVLRRVSTFDLPCLDRELTCVARDLAAVQLSGKNQSYTVGNYSRYALSLLLALLCGNANASGTAEGGNTREMFKSKIGMDMEAFTFSLVKWLSEQQARGSRAKQVRLRKAHSFVIVSSLHFICSSFEHAGMSVENLRVTVSLVAEYTSVSCQALQSDSPTHDPDESRSAASILFGTSRLLAATAKVIPASCPTDILQVSLSSYMPFDQSTICSRARLCFH